MLSLVILVALCTAIRAEFVRNPESVTVNEGDSVTLTCEETSYYDAQFSCSDYVYYWRRNTPTASEEDLTHCISVESDFNDRMTVTKDGGLYTLTIMNVRPEDGGDYYCYIYYSFFYEYHSDTALLTVNALPRNTPSPSLTVPEDSNSRTSAVYEESPTQGSSAQTHSPVASTIDSASPTPESTQGVTSITESNDTFFGSNSSEARLFWVIVAGTVGLIFLLLVVVLSCCLVRYKKKAERLRQAQRPSREDICIDSTKPPENSPTCQDVLQESRVHLGLPNKRDNIEGTVYANMNPDKPAEENETTRDGINEKTMYEAPNIVLPGASK